jgi:2-phospho-L-lactate guanylyltransferase (CobY/MobA/RfbA family)
MTTIVVPYRPDGKTRLRSDVDVHLHHSLVSAMLEDVIEACGPVGDVVVCDAPGGQGSALEAALARMSGPVAIVNADLPSATTEEIEQLAAAAAALVAAPDGTTNALSLQDARHFRPLYGPDSAQRFERALGAVRLDLPGLVADVDTSADLVRVQGRVGRHTRAALEVLV